MFDQSENNNPTSLSSSTIASTTFVPPSTVTTVAPPTACITTLCAQDCGGQCGWSSTKNKCSIGGHTTTPEAQANPCVSDIPTAQSYNDVEDICPTITCPRDYKAPCGWSRKKSGCAAGATTTASELRLGACEDVIGVRHAAPRLAPQSSKSICNVFTCAKYCAPPCGWSLQTHSCIFGATTTALELHLGDC